MLTGLAQRDSNKNLLFPMRNSMLRASVLLTLLLIVGIMPAYADDTEIFSAGTVAAPDATNIVFLVDTSGSMEGEIQSDTGAGGSPKIEEVQKVFETLIFDGGDRSKINPVLYGKNIALMRFDDGNSNGGYFLTPLLKLDTIANANTLWNQIFNLTHNAAGERIFLSSNTPLSESSYEAALYFLGKKAHYGISPTSSPGSNDPGIMDQNKIYLTPLADENNLAQCGYNNHLIMLSDGMPTSDGNADSMIQTLTGSSCSYSTRDHCAKYVAEFLAKGNLVNDNEFARVQTHTIAFDLRDSNGALTLLSDIAQMGGEGVAAKADNTAELEKAIRDILTDIQESTATNVNPAVSVSSANRFTHDNTVYFGLFKPMRGPRWGGNLKGFKYNNNGDLIDFSAEPLAVLDNGVFNPKARSKWLDTGADPDGGDISAGGAAAEILKQSSPTENNIGHTDRNIVTYITTTDNNNNTSQVKQAFNYDNREALTPELFGLNANDTDTRNKILLWATNRRTNPVNDPLHSTPQVINYGGDLGSLIFFGTNQGFLHAIRAGSSDDDPLGGSEVMAFIPESLLPNLRTLTDNNSQFDHPYGLDGHISFYRYDANGDNEINAVDNDKVIVIVGMRRGGNEYFALDVTTPSSPSLLWTIKGGSGVFADLGQTWSKPISTVINFGSLNDTTQKRVVLIGGGYDEQYDELTNTISNPAGAALYAVDIETGDCVWSASDSANGCASHTTISELTDSIPSHISAIDLTADGVMDRLYAIDIMGRIFRVDFNFTDDKGNYIFEGQILADLSGGDRRFYYGVDVAYTNSNFIPKLHLTVGSGHRAHPLAASSDIVASVFDKSVTSKIPEGFETITINNDNLTYSLTNLTSLEATMPGTTSGWYFNLPSNEKILAEATSIAGYVFLTSYLPPGTGGGTGQQTASCNVASGAGNVYAVNLADASALDNARAIPIATTGISSSVAFITLLQEPADGDGTATDNPLASQDTEVFAMANGTKINLSPEAHNTINSALEASKLYWYSSGTPPVAEETNTGDDNTSQ